MGRMRGGNLLLLVLALSFSSFAGACSFVPTAEIKVFRESVVAANAAATPMLDELSAAERKAQRDKMTTQNRIAARKGEATTFDPTQAGFFSDIGDAPATAKLRQGHVVLDRLSDVLVALATGAGAEADADSMQSLATEAIAMASLLAPGAAAAAPVVGSLHEALVQISKEASRREARRVILAAQESKLVSKLVANLIAATPPVFDKLVEAAQLRAGPQSSADANVAAVERYSKVRVVLSNYVILLREVDMAWSEAANAAISNAPGNTAILTERISDLRAATIATRRSFAELHTGR